MIFAKRAELLRFAELSAGIYGWETVKTIPVKIELSAKTNLFSKVGIGVKSAQIMLRGTGGITLSNALRAEGQFYFLTSILREGILLNITAAQVRLVDCALWRTIEEKDEYKRPILRPLEKVLEFPAILTEKYVRFEQKEPMAQTETALVLVTPKEIRLEPSDLVESGGVKYAIQACHTLDEYKNEYEIYRKEDT